MGLLTTISSRWKAKTPVFFKKLRNLAVTISAMSTAVLTAASTTNIVVPPSIIKVASDALIAAAAIGATAQLTKQDTPTT